MVPSLTTDAVVFRRKSGVEDVEVLLITRKYDPGKGKHALPGGFVDYNEDPLIGCLRELEEETGLKGINCELLTVTGNPLRDPRGHTVSIVYLVTVSEDAVPKGGDDAETATFYSFAEMLKSKEKFAFDHYDILVQAAKKINFKI